MATFDHIASDNSHGSSPHASAFGTTPSAGNTLIVSATWGSSDSVPTIASSNGNTFTLAQSQIEGGSQAGAAVWVANNCNAGAETVTITLAGQVLEVIKSEYAKGSQPLQVDKVASAVSGGSANPNSGNTAVTSAAAELVYGFVMNHNVDSTAGSGFTVRQSAGFNFFEDSEDKVVSSTGVQAAIFTASSSAWICICVTLMETSAGGGVIGSNFYRQVAGLGGGF